MDESKVKKMVSRAMKCRHCGGAMRFYRDGITCLMCGRSMEHRCECCRFTENRELLQKKVA